MACVIFNICRFMPTSDSYKLKSRELHEQIMLKYDEYKLTNNDDALFLKSLADIIDLIEKNASLKQISKMYSEKSNSDVSFIRKTLLEFANTIIDFNNKAHSICIPTKDLKKENLIIKEKLKEFFRLNKDQMNITDKEFIKYLYKLPALILLKIGINYEKI